MAYSTNAQVVLEFKSLGTGAGSTIPTSTIDSWITEADSYIDGRLSTLYVTPITGTISLSIVKTISIWLVVDRINAKMQVKNAGRKEGLKDYRQLAEDMIKDILLGNIRLHDATRARSDGGIASYQNDNDIESSFDMTVDNW